VGYQANSNTKKDSPTVSPYEPSTIESETINLSTNLGDIQIYKINPAGSKSFEAKVDYYQNEKLVKKLFAFQTKQKKGNFLFHSE
jgi:hypothetical protein